MVIILLDNILLILEMSELWNRRTIVSLDSTKLVKEVFDTYI